jgi:transcriptional regulator with XRE-family HTH domain
MEHKVHEGRNVKRFREMLGLKQEALAFELGQEWTQKKVSLLEAKEVIESPLLQRIAEVMKIPVEAFKNFDEELAVTFISNTFESGAIGYARGDVQNFNPIEAVLKLHEEKIALYERMLKEKEEMMEALKKLIPGVEAS